MDPQHPEPPRRTGPPGGDIFSVKPAHFSGTGTGARLRRATGLRSRPAPVAHALDIAPGTVKFPTYYALRLAIEELRASGHR